MDNLTAKSATDGWSDSVLPIGRQSDPCAFLKTLRRRSADEGALRMQLAECLNELIREKGLTQTAVSGVFGIPQPHISELRHYKLSRFSSERLLRYITLLGSDVEIVIRSAADGGPGGTLTVARIG